MIKVFAQLKKEGRWSVEDAFEKDPSQPSNKQTAGEDQDLKETPAETKDDKESMKLQLRPSEDVGDADEIDKVKYWLWHHSSSAHKHYLNTLLQSILKRAAMRDGGSLFQHSPRIS